MSSDLFRTGCHIKHTGANLCTLKGFFHNLPNTLADENGFLGALGRPQDNTYKLPSRPYYLSASKGNTLLQRVATSQWARGGHVCSYIEHRGCSSVIMALTMFEGLRFYRVRSTLGFFGSCGVAAGLSLWKYDSFA